MDITHKFYNRISYDLTITYVGDSIKINMHTQDFKSEKNFETAIDCDDQLKKEFPTTGELFEFLGKEDNFVVDPINGKISLLVRKT